MSEEYEIAYTAVTRGTRVLTSDGHVIGTLERVLDIPDLDLFDGIVIVTADGDRFIDRDQIARITTVAVHCELTLAEAATLSVPDSAPTYRADPGPSGKSMSARFKRLFKKPKWERDRDEQ